MTLYFQNGLGNEMEKAPTTTEKIVVLIPHLSILFAHTPI
jgi:hypothetical protein